MKNNCSWRVLFVLVIYLLFLNRAGAQFSFLPIDNFESGKNDKWYRFGNVQMNISANSSAEGKDTIVESCGSYSLKIKGWANNWYVGGLGTNLGVDATPFSRLQMDVLGSETGGKLKVELFDDDNNNFTLEQDPASNWLPTKDDKLVAEVPIFGKGWTRISIPFSAFRLENQGMGDGVWNPDQINGSGGLLKMQIILVSDKARGEVEANIDNIVLTY